MIQELRILDSAMFPTHYVNPFEQEGKINQHKHNMTCQKNRKKRKKRR